MNDLHVVESAHVRDDIPEFRPGDTVKVHVRVVEGGRERVQVFEGVVIARNGTGAACFVHGPQDQLRHWG